MANKDKVILDLCGNTGAWSDPYRKAGYTVIVVTWPDYDVRTILMDKENIYLCKIGEKIKGIPIKSVHGILAAPPCTMFSRARTTAKAPRDFDAGMEVVRACLKLIWHCKANGSLQWWCLENPMGYLRQFLGDPPHSFRGWEFGDEHVKFTDLWGYYKMPVGRFKKRVAFSKQKYAAPRKPKQYAHMKLDRAAIRAITPAGFARAFAKLNK